MALPSLLKNAIRAVAMLGLLGATGTPPARADTPIENGCGPSGILTWVVPDYIPVAGCKLVGACNAHDRCYSKCLPGQPLHGKPTCKDETARAARRNICDNRLYNDIISTNPGSWTCKGVAGIYRKFVVTYGMTHFMGAVPGPDKEALYRIPPELAALELAQSPEEMKRTLATNYAEMQEFTAYLDANPGTFEPAEAQAAIDSAAELGADPASVLAFSQDGSGAKFVLMVPEPGNPTREFILWESARP